MQRYEFLASGLSSNRLPDSVSNIQASHNIEDSEGRRSPLIPSSLFWLQATGTHSFMYLTGTSRTKFFKNDEAVSKVYLLFSSTLNNAREGGGGRRRRSQEWVTRTPGDHRSVKERIVSISSRQNEKRPSDRVANSCYCRSFDLSTLVSISSPGQIDVII